MTTQAKSILALVLGAAIVAISAIQGFAPADLGLPPMVAKWLVVVTAVLTFILTQMHAATPDRLSGKAD